MDTQGNLNLPPRMPSIYGNTPKHRARYETARLAIEACAGWRALRNEARFATYANMQEPIGCYVRDEKDSYGNTIDLAYLTDERLHEALHEASECGLIHKLDYCRLVHAQFADGCDADEFDLFGLDE